MKKAILIVTGILLATVANAQFAPPAGIAGTTAIHKDSSVFVAWATGCTVSRGWQDISNTAAGLATIGDSSNALGMADGISVVSLGDGGSATLTFDNPVTNGPGWDFAVFENSFLQKPHPLLISYILKLSNHNEHRYFHHLQASPSSMKDVHKS